MNIWDVVFAIVGGLAKQAVKTQDDFQKRIGRYEEKYKDLDHEELVKKYRESTGDARLAAGVLLKKEMQKKQDKK